MKKNLALIFLLASQITYSQIGGSSVFGFLNFPNSAKISALGGTNVSLTDSSMHMGFQNPSLLVPAVSNQVDVSYIFYFAEIRSTFFSYAYDFKRFGTAALGIQNVNYGDFTQADETGERSGTFTAHETYFNLAYSYPVDSLFRFGISIKPIFSELESYSSNGIALDAGLTYFNPENGLTVALVMKNYGTQLKTYYGSDKEDLPFEIQMGLSKKLKHAPFRFSVTARHLDTPVLTYKKTNNAEPVNSPQYDKEVDTYDGVVDAAMRHLIFAIEFMPLKSLSAWVGYNYIRRKELQIENNIGKVGFSWGLGLKLNKFSLSYGNAIYHLAGSTSQFSLSLNLNEITKRKAVKS